MLILNAINYIVIDFQFDIGKQFVQSALTGDLERGYRGLCINMNVIYMPRFLQEMEDKIQRYVTQSTFIILI